MTNDLAFVKELLGNADRAPLPTDHHYDLCSR